MINKLQNTKSELENNSIVKVPELNPEIFVETVDQSKLYEITTDGKTVWVNDAFKCLARFGVNSYNLNLPNSGIIRLHLERTHMPFTEFGELPKEAWVEFVRDVKTHFNIDVSDHYMPERLKNE